MFNKFLRICSTKSMNNILKNLHHIPKAAPHRISQNGRRCHQHISENAFLLFLISSRYITLLPMSFTQYIHKTSPFNQACCLVTVNITATQLILLGNKKSGSFLSYHLGMLLFLAFPNYLSLSVRHQPLRFPSLLLSYFIFFSVNQAQYAFQYSHSSSNKVQEATEFTIPFL